MQNDPPTHKYIGWGLLMAPLGAAIGFLIIEISADLMTQRNFLNNSELTNPGIWIFVPFYGLIFSAPVTMMIMPMIRFRYPNQSFTAFMKLVLGSVVAGFIWCSIIPLVLFFKSEWRYLLLGTLIPGASGSGSAFVLTPLYFYMTKLKNDHQPRP